jgi:hypothetical protein
LCAAPTASAGCIAWFDDLTAGGYWCVSRLRARTSFTIQTVFAHHGDTLGALIWLGAYRADRAAAVVRLVQFRQGGELRRYITHVLNPERLGAAEVARLNARRWEHRAATATLPRQPPGRSGPAP